MKYLVALMLILSSSWALAFESQSSGPYIPFGGAYQWAEDSEIVELMMEEIRKVELEIEEEIAQLSGETSEDYDPSLNIELEIEIDGEAFGADNLGVDGGGIDALLKKEGPQNIEIEINAHKEASTGSKYGWGKALNGYGYCYKWTKDGRVLNEGQPVANKFCEQVDPSYFSWGTAHNGHTYCYQYTSDHVAMNGGSPVADSYCED